MKRDGSAVMDQDKRNLACKKINTYWVLYAHRSCEIIALGARETRVEVTRNCRKNKSLKSNPAKTYITFAHK